MPKKPATNVDKQMFDGTIALFVKLHALIKDENVQLEELKAQIKALIRQFGTASEREFTYDHPSGVRIVLSLQEREDFNIAEAMTLLEALPPKQAANYIQRTTTKDLFHQALLDGAIDPKDAKKCVTLKPIEALSIKKD